VPAALWLTRKHFNTLHEHVLCIHINVSNIPYVSAVNRVQMESFDKGFRRIELIYGFKDEIDIPATLRAIDPAFYDRHLERATYVVNRQLVQVQPGEGMSLWSKKLFVFLLRNGHPGFRAFNLPAGQVVELGSRLVL
jgi:KUP system potassium uptake protein